MGSIFGGAPKVQQPVDTERQKEAEANAVKQRQAIAGMTGRRSLNYPQETPVVSTSASG